MVGLVAAYFLDEGFGSTAGDVAGHSLNGTVVGAAWTASGQFRQAIDFDGVNEAVSFPDANALDLANTGTMEAWVKLDTFRTF